MNSLLYRRQFLMTRSEVAELAGWRHQEVEGGRHLYLHPDLQVARAAGPGRGLTLLGYLFDPQHPERGNREILDDLALQSSTFENALLHLKPLCGRFVLVWETSSEVRLVSDAIGLREIYYCGQPENCVICGSQATLLDHCAEPALGPATDPAILHFQQHDLPRVGHGNQWIGSETATREIRHLPPNHYLDVASLSAERYWPTQSLERLDLAPVVEQSSRFLQGVMKAAAQRQDLAVAITAGLDSRTLLAAAKDLADRIHFFINSHHFLAAGTPDVIIGQKLMDRVGQPYHIHRVDESTAGIPDDFREAYFASTPFASARQLPTVYRVYHQTLPDKLNVCGVGEIGRSRFGRAPRRLTPYRLAHLYGYRDSEYAVAQAERWLEEAAPVAQQTGLNPLTLFYWEQDLGNWGAVGNAESDIAIEEFNPYNSHALLELFLSLDDRHTTLHRNRLFREMIGAMDSRLLDFPINPPLTPRHRIGQLAREMKLYGWYRAWRLRQDERAFRARQP